MLIFRTTLMVIGHMLSVLESICKLGSNSALQAECIASNGEECLIKASLNNFSHKLISKGKNCTIF